MAKYNSKKNTRRKAIFGSNEAATLAAAGITAAATLAGAAIGAKSTKDQAKQQAAALRAQAERQSLALDKQNEVSRSNMEMQQELLREENAQAREIQKDMQMNLQMLAGQQNQNDRYEASRIVVRQGGKKGKRKLRNAVPLLRGDNIPFTVTDGGGVVPIGQTPEGYDIYEIEGDNHKQYHKTRGGKYKSGVGIKFADGEVVEGEGNKNNNGELLMVTPNDGYFLSKHTLGGFNPAHAVKAGMHPMEAYATQEAIKQQLGVNDDGSSTPVEGNMNTRSRKLLRLAGGNANYIIPYNNSFVDNMSIVYPAANEGGLLAKRQIARNGRRKAPGGTRSDDSILLPDAWIPANIGLNQIVDNYPANYGTIAPYTGYIGTEYKYPTVKSKTSEWFPDTNSNKFNLELGRLKQPVTSSNNNPTVRTKSNWFNRWGSQLAGAGVTALGNIVGAGITSHAARRAGNTIARALGDAAAMKADAYSRMTGIDLSNIKRDDFKQANAMAAIQAPVNMTAAPLSLVDRSLQRTLSNAERYSASSASANSRMMDAEIAASDRRNQIYTADNERREKINQANMERITTIANENANRAIQEGKDWLATYMEGLMYNNDIENEKIAGIANAYGDALVGGAEVRATGMQTGSNAWASAATNSLAGFGNVLSSQAKARQDFLNVIAGADMDGKVSAIALRNDVEAAKSLYNTILNAANDPSNPESVRKVMADRLAILRGVINGTNDKIV